MESEHVSARFECREELETAMCDLRRLGAVHCPTALWGPPGRAPETVHLSVSAAEASMARAILRRAGGVILPP